MNGIFFDITPENTTMVASNAHKLVCYTRNDVKGNGASGFILPKKPANILKNNLAKLGDENVEISLHPAMQLLQIEANQRKEFLSFLSAHNITLEEFTQAKQLDLFFVVTDNIAVNISNGRGGCWEIDKIAIRRKTNAELEELVLPSYNLYVSGCRLLGIPPRSLDSVLWDIKYYI